MKDSIFRIINNGNGYSFYISRKFWKNWSHFLEYPGLTQKEGLNEAIELVLDKKRY